MACGDYDFLRPLINGEIQPQGIDLNVLTMPSPKISAQSRFTIGPDDDTGAVFGHALGLTPDLVEAAMANREPAPQADEGITYAEKISPADRELDWSLPPRELHNRIRALSPHIGARGIVEGRAVIVWRSRLVDGKLELLEVQPEGRRRMKYDEFLRGLRR